MKINYKNFKRGFTIAEVVVVIGIMTIITTVVLASINASKKQSRDQKRIEEISTVQLALGQYYSRKKFYPDSLIDADLGKFLVMIPGDVKYAPLKINTGDSRCTTYHLYVTLESRISVLDDKKGFNSNSKTNCIATPDNRIDASLPANALIYDVIPN